MMDELIVIKKADKGSNIVIQNRKDYLREGNQQLSDQNFCIVNFEIITEFKICLVIFYLPLCTVYFWLYFTWM